MVITMMFAWHMAAAFILLLSLGLAVRLIERCCCLETPDGSLVPLASNGRHYDRIKLVSADPEGGGRDENRNSTTMLECEGDGSGGSGDETMFERRGRGADMGALGEEEI